MANIVYPTYRIFLGSGAGTLDLTAVDVKVSAIDVAAYTYNQADEFFDDIPGAAVIATSTALANKALLAASGAFDADDIEFAGFAGASIEALVVWADSGVPGTSRLLAYIDTAAGLPFTPDGAPKLVRWSASGIFQP